MSPSSLRRIRVLFWGGLALGALQGVPAASMQGLPSPLAPTNPTPLVYCPPERLAAGSAHARHVLNVFLPLGAPPVDGWPVVVATGYGGGASVPPVASLSSMGASAPLWNLVQAGIAVVHFGTPGIGGGRGMWFPPGHPSGRYESWRPADDNPEKSAEWALQWVKVQTLHPFNLERVGMRGSSGGAVLSIRTAMGLDRARSSGSAQVRASTRVAAILAIQPPTSAWALAQGPELTIQFPKHLEQAARPGVPAVTLDQVAPELQKDYSLMRSAFGNPEARAHNAGQALCLVYGDPVLRIGGSVASLELDATGFPVLHDAILQPLQHDSWFGYVFWLRLLGLSPESAAFHGANSVFAIRDTSALPAPNDVHTRTFRGTVLGPSANRIGHDWLVARLTQPLAVRARSALRPGWIPQMAGGPTAARGDLESRALEVRHAGMRWTVALRSEPDGPAWLLLARASRGSGTGTPEFGIRRLDPRGLLAPPVQVPREAGVDGRTEMVLDLPSAETLPAAGLELQVWGIRRGRPWSSNVLFLEAERPRAER